MPFQQKLKGKFFRSSIFSKLSRVSNSSGRSIRRQEALGRRRLLLENLEERRLLAAIDMMDDEIMDEAQPHFFGSQSLLVASGDPSPGETPWDPAKSEAHIRAVAERVMDNPHYRVDEFGNVMAINPNTTSLTEGDNLTEGDKKNSKDENQGPSLQNPFPAGQTFLLNSLPGASKTVYLDFNGHVTSGTGWNNQFFGGASFTTDPLSFEGTAGTFSDNELFRIQRIWERVAEDFLPFHVNVTTQEPPLSSLIRSGGGDTQWGVRVVIGPGNWLAGAGGVAFLDSFNWNSDTPCFVFSNALGNSEKSIAEATSHEVGHTLGLEHDGQGGNEYYTGHGSGATGWAPIMGVGYNRELVQWSKGEYTNATQTQDDLAIITSLNGFTYRTDGNGNSTGTATPLTLVGNSGTANGIIERNTDIDFFSFNTTGGNVVVNLTPFYRGPNLDILAKLYNSSGTEIASNNPTSTLNASFNVSLSSGNYFLSVQGTGKAAAGSDLGYSNYGSLGYYSISATIPQQVPTLAATLVGGNLTITDSNGVVNQLSAEIQGSDLVITDANEKFLSAPVGGVLSNNDRTLTFPVASVTGSVIFDPAGGNDSVTVGLWMAPNAPGISVNGGSGTDSVDFTAAVLPAANKSVSVTAESVSVSAAGLLAVSGAGTISLVADDIAIAASASIASAVSAVTITPQTNGRAIVLGSELAGQLSLTATEIDRISASTLVVGNALSGPITVNSSIARTNPVNLELRSGGDILIAGGTINTAGGSLLLAPGAAPAGVKPKLSGTDLTASTVSFASDLILEINGATPDSGYDRLVVSGSVNLTGVDLVIAGSFPAITGSETFSIVSADNIIGTFNGLPDGAPVLVHGQTFYINYSSTTVQLVPAVVNSTISQAYVYHVNSTFAGGGITPALDTQKVLAKEVATPTTLTMQNLINSSRGINGIVIDFDGLPVTSLSTSDFQFQVSPQGAFLESSNPPGNWQAAPALPTISVIPGTLDRVILEWPDNSIVNRWLRITVNANVNTGLAASETYYIGHLLGETTGESGGVYSVTFADITPIRGAVGQTVNSGSLHDIDKNGQVTFADISAMRGNVGTQLTNITIPAAGSGIPMFAPVGPTQTSGQLTRLTGDRQNWQLAHQIESDLASLGLGRNSSFNPARLVGGASNQVSSPDGQVASSAAGTEVVRESKVTEDHLLFSAVDQFFDQF